MSCVSLVRCRRLAHERQRYGVLCGPLMNNFTINLLLQEVPLVLRHERQAAIVCNDLASSRLRPRLFRTTPQVRLRPEMVHECGGSRRATHKPVPICALHAVPGFVLGLLGYVDGLSRQWRATLLIVLIVLCVAEVARHRVPDHSTLAPRLFRKARAIVLIEYSLHHLLLVQFLLIVFFLHFFRAKLILLLELEYFTLPVRVEVGTLRAPPQMHSL